MFLINFWSLFQVQSYLPLSIINYGVSKHYAGSMVSDRCPLGYLFHLLITGSIPIDPKHSAIKGLHRTSLYCTVKYMCAPLAVCVHAGC